MRQLRLAAHVHTAASDDSDWDLDRLARLLQRTGFHGMLVCDHDRTMTLEGWDRLQDQCNRVGDERGFLIVPGIEYQDPDHVVHLPVFGAHRFLGQSPDISAAIESAHGDGAAAVFAHPRRRDAYQRFDASWAAGLAGVEVWNRKYDGISPNEWAFQVIETHRLRGLVSLDWHGPRQLFPLAWCVSDPGRGSNAARAAAVVRAIVAGDVRATAFGLPVELFHTGGLNTALRTVERLRAWTAPGIRRLEAMVRAR